MSVSGRTLSSIRKAVGSVSRLSCPSLLGLVLVSPTPAHAEVRVGIAVPLTGRMAPVGIAIERALRDAIAEANANGGIHGQPITLEIADDGCTTAVGEGAARRLIAQRPALVIGHPCANAAVPAAPLYGGADVLLMVVGARHPDVTRANDSVKANVLRLAGRDDRQGEAAAGWLLAHAPAQRVAIVHDRTQYARTLADATAAALAQAGVTSPTVLSLKAGRPEYDEVARALRDSGAEALFFAGYPDEAAILNAALERLGSALSMLGSDSLATDAFAETVESSRARIEVLMPAAITGASLSPSTDAERLSLEARAAFEVWMEGAGKIGSIDAQAISRALREGAVSTPSLGVIRFDAHGDVIAPSFAAANVRAGRWMIR